MSECKRAIMIETNSKEEQMRIGTNIHEQLRGNQDYIDSNIVLNCTDSDNNVYVYIYNDCKYVPPIAIY